ncbi:unnamed protein product, partial [Mesorhabditis spiculigera]
MLRRSMLVCALLLLAVHLPAAHAQEGGKAECPKDPGRPLACFVVRDAAQRSAADVDDHYYHNDHDHHHHHYNDDHNNNDDYHNYNDDYHYDNDNDHTTTTTDNYRHYDSYSYDHSSYSDNHLDGPAGRAFAVFVLKRMRTVVVVVVETSSPEFFPDLAEILANDSLARICYPRPLKTYILGQGRYKPWCTEPHANPFEPKNVASWGCMILPFCKLGQPGEFDEQKYLRPVSDNGDLLNCMDICPRNENGRGLTEKPDCRPIPSNPEKDYFGVLSITEKLDWCDVEKSRRRDPWSLNPPCNPIPQCRGNVDGRAPDTRDWRKNLLYYKNDVAGIPCVVYKQCSALTEEERKEFHCVGSVQTTSTTKASTTTTAKTTAKTTTEKPKDGLGDEVILIAALGGGLLVFIVVIIIVLCFCLKKKDQGPKGSKPIVDDMMNVGVGTAVVDLDVHCKHWRKVSIRLHVSTYSIQRSASPSLVYH